LLLILPYIFGRHCLSNGILTEIVDNLSADEGKVASSPSTSTIRGVFLATFSSSMKGKASRRSELSRGRSSFLRLPNCVRAGWIVVKGLVEWKREKAMKGEKCAEEPFRGWEIADFYNLIKCKYNVKLNIEKKVLK
jgi:hypothetical protein